MTRTNQEDARQSYDTVADEYVRRVSRELEHKPFDREQLDRFAGQVRPGGIVVDMGCGPGHVGRYLHDRGLEVCGVDLSERMVEEAGRLNPGMEFLCEDMTNLSAPDGWWAAMVAFYSIIHVARGEVADALRGFARVLEPEAPLLLAFHLGEDRIHLDRWWEREVSLDFLMFRTGEMLGYLAEAGFEVDQALERDPYAEDVEAPTRRCYIFARTPAERPRQDAPAQ